MSCFKISLPSFCVSPKFLVLDEHSVQLQRFVRSEFFAQQHVADVDWVGEIRFLSQFFKGRIGIVVVHRNIVVERRASPQELYHLRAPQIMQVHDTVEFAVGIDYGK